ncbi:hypothetical protein MTP03_24310 [Tsukamurella sp. PLM1]|nr:hypothetical protein MTP03_24310 [Tsukamurella sp. PLM1]
MPFAQDASILMIAERTNSNGSKAFREAMLAGDHDKCVDIAKDQIRDGSHMLDLNVDYVGRDGALDMAALAARLATASTLPIMIDSTEPEVIKAGLEHLGGRCAVNSVNYEDGDGPDSRFTKIMEQVVAHGAAVVALTIDEEGQARTAEGKVRIAERLIADLTGNWGLSLDDIIIDPLVFPISTGQEEVRRDALETIEAVRVLHEKYPSLHFTVGLSNVSFGLNPAARQVLNSVFLNELREAGLDSAILHASKILPMSKMEPEQRETALDLVYDRRAPPACSPVATPITTRSRGSWNSSRAFRRPPPRRPGRRSWRSCRCSSAWSGASSTVSGRASTPISMRPCRRSRRCRSSTTRCCPA